MKRSETSVIPGVFAAGLIGGLVLAAFLLAPAWGGSRAGANPKVAVGIDGDPSADPANEATSLGSREACISIDTAVNDEFEVDFFVDNDVQDLKAFEATLSYDHDIVNVIGNDGLWLLAAGGDSVWVLPSPLPDATGNFLFGAVDLSTPGTHSGEGVLARLTLRAVGTGITELSLHNVSLEQPGNVEIGDEDEDGWFDEPIYNAIVGVDVSLPDSDGDNVCDAGDLCLGTAPGDPADEFGCSDAQVDGDGDGFCDPDAPSSGPSGCIGSDNCPDDPNAGQEDGDQDGAGDVCDNCPGKANPGQENSDGDDLGNACDNCPLVTNPDQSNVDLDPYGDVCDTDADGDGFPNVMENRHAGSDWLDTMCQNNINDDPGDDSKVNDGCPRRGGIGHAEEGTQCDNNSDDDADTMVNDGCPVAGTRSEGSTIEVCDGLDNDGDGSIDEDFPDSDQDGTKDCLEDNVDTDGDTDVNSIDLDDDSDGDPDPGFNDGFSDVVEAWTGLDSLDACPDDVNDDAWVPDSDNTTIVNIIDIMVFKGKVGTMYGLNPAYSRRLDWDANQIVNIVDVMLIRRYVGTMCS
jgi:hypothetical protein